MLIQTLAWPQTEPVSLSAFRQPSRSFHEPGAAGVPSGIGAALSRPQAGVEVLKSEDGSYWVGSASGLFRCRQPSCEGDGKEYYAGRRYLKDDDVQALVSDGNLGVWVRTATGITHLALLHMTLAHKAAILEQNIRLRHDRHGFVAPSHLTTKGDLTSNRMNPDDNDGLWTAMYAAAHWFRYGVSRSSDALARAVRATEAVLSLEQVTGRPGYPARSYIRKGEWRGTGGVWHWTKDGAYEWKADTSSDELVGHFYLFGVAWELAPKEGAEALALRARIAANCERIMDHILANHYNLTDIHGLPTYWGQWSPAYFATGRGRPDSPLNALELLSFLKTAHRVAGKEAYALEYRKVARELGYARLTARLLELREELNYSDEELAFLPFYLLIRHEQDPQLLAIYRQAIDQWWQNASREKNPLWTLIYLSCNPESKVDLTGAVRTLEQIPVDQVTWTVKNSHRTDVLWDNSVDRFRIRQSAALLPASERPIMKWNGNPFRTDGGDDGGREEDGTYFLLPYWMGRYHRYLLGE